MTRPIVNGPANRGLLREPLNYPGSDRHRGPRRSSGRCRSYLLHQGPKRCPAQGSRAAKPKRVAFDAAYRTQLFETGIPARATEHGVPLASSLGEELEARSPASAAAIQEHPGHPDFDDRHRPGKPTTGGTRHGPADWLFCLVRSVSSRALPQSPLWRNGLGGLAV